MKVLLRKKGVFDESISHGFDVPLNFQTNVHRHKTTERLLDRGTAGTTGKGKNNGFHPCFFIRNVSNVV